MVSKNVVSGVSRACNPEAVQVLKDKVANSVWAQPSRCSPNADKLVDGAIQRESVSVPAGMLEYTHLNPEKIGAYKRPEHNVKSSTKDARWMAPWDRQLYRSKVARIYMPQRKHVHCHPTNKTMGHHWALEFASWGNYKSPLMGWTSGSEDVYDRVSMKFGTLDSAVSHCVAMGWGYDISYPTGIKWHQPKNYANNFKWKGEPKERESYD